MGNLLKGAPTGVTPPIIDSGHAGPGTAAAAEITPAATMPPSIMSRLPGALSGLQNGLQSQQDQGRQAMANTPQMGQVPMMSIPQYSPEQLNPQSLGPYARKRKQ